MPTADAISTALRPFRLSDLPAVNRVKTEGVLDMLGPRSRVVRLGHTHNPKRSHGSPEYWKHAIVALADGEVCGVARSQGAKLSDLWVATAWRSRGIGAALVAAAVSGIRRRGYRRAFLYTAQFNQRGRAFYERHGWQLQGYAQHRVCHFRRCVYVKPL